MPVLCLSFAVVLVDQLTKHLVLTQLDRYAGHVLIPGFFDFQFVQNTGAAWGMMQGMSGWLVGLSLVMLAMIVIFRRHFLGDGILARVAAGCIVGGIIGNLIDRLRSGYVVDFLDFHWRGHHFPAFNVADAAICIGVGLYMITQWRQTTAAGGRSESRNPKSE